MGSGITEVLPATGVGKHRAESIAEGLKLTSIGVLQEACHSITG
jgi:hypothetical protein